MYHMNLTNGYLSNQIFLHDALPISELGNFKFASQWSWNVVLREGSTPCAMVLQSRCEVIFGYHMDLTNGYLGNQKLEYRKFPVQSYGTLNLLLKGTGMF